METTNQLPSLAATEARSEFAPRPLSPGHIATRSWQSQTTESTFLSHSLWASSGRYKSQQRRRTIRQTTKRQPLSGGCRFALVAALRCLRVGRGPNSLNLRACMCAATCASISRILSVEAEGPQGLGTSRSTIYLDAPLPVRSSGLPASLLSGPLYLLPGGNRTTLLGLAPHGVCLAARVATRAGELLPPLFTPYLCLGKSQDHRRVSFLLHMPSSAGGGRADAFRLGSTVPFGVRTFLTATRAGQRSDALKRTP